MDLPAFRSRNYRLYFAGQSLSMTGSFMTQVAILWLIYKATDSALLLGISGFLGQLPVFLLAPVSGILADRYNRKHLMILLQVLGISISIALMIVSFLGWANFWVLLSLGTLSGVLKGLDVPIRHAFVTDIVNREEMNSAISLNYAFLNTARLLGPAMGGIAIAKVGAGFCFLYDSVSYIAVLVALFAMQIAPRKVESHGKHPWHNLKEGFKYAYAVLPIRTLLLLLALASLLNMSYATLLPIFSVEVFQGDAATMGFLTAASALGAVFACLYLSFRKGIQGLHKLIAFCPASLGVAMIIFSYSHMFWLSVAALTLVGFSSTLQVAASNTVIQHGVEESKRGRVMSFYTMCFMGMSPFGNLILGSSAHAIGAQNTLAIGGMVCIVGSLLFVKFLPAIAQWVQVGLQSHPSVPSQSAQ
ncbi:MFS transporter [Tumidithrix elongata RA019]|uniref:MFS transporter n=2 Tax=Tumidithrix TaxID=3088355 RepID=A0AAW9Q537_9CYAN|nr:MFS transporter [Tumidithrix elongata RA019]